jgi:hypothetical protein
MPFFCVLVLFCVFTVKIDRRKGKKDSHKTETVVRMRRRRGEERRRSVGSEVVTAVTEITIFWVVTRFCSEKPPMFRSNVASILRIGE